MDPWIEGLWPALRAELSMKPEGESPAEILGQNKTDKEETTKNELLINRDPGDTGRNLSDKSESINDLKETAANSDQTDKSQGNSELAKDKKTEIEKGIAETSKAIGNTF